MKKFFSVLLCGLLTALCAAPAVAADVPYATAVNGTPVVDGQIDDVWATAEAYTANALKDGTEENITTEWKAMWDDSNLYILAVVSGDKDHFTGTSQSWGDGVELYFDVQNSDAEDYTTDDGIIQLGWNVADMTNTAFKGTEAGIANADGNYTVVCVENDDGYVYEFSFNLVDFCKNFSMKEGVAVGFEIQVNSKNAEGDGRTSAYGWADPDNAAWQYPYLMGDLELVAAPVAETVVDESAPQTFDMGAVAAVAAVVSAAGYALSRKR